MYIIPIQYINKYNYSYSFHSFKRNLLFIWKGVNSKTLQCNLPPLRISTTNTIQHDTLFVQQLLLLRVYSLLTISRQTWLATELVMTTDGDTCNIHVWSSIYQATIRLLCIPVVILHLKLNCMGQNAKKSEPYLFLKFVLKHFSRDKMVAILQIAFLNAFSWIKTFILIQSSLWFVPWESINNISSLVQIMAAWRPTGDKPLSEPMIG